MTQKSAKTQIQITDYRLQIQIQRFRRQKQNHRKTKKQIQIQKTEREQRESARGKKTKSLPDEIAEQMLQIWNAEVQSKLTKGQSARITPKRKQQMAERWRQISSRTSGHGATSAKSSAAIFALAMWQARIGRLTSAGRWNPPTMAKILEGGFSGGNHPPAPACDVPGLQQAWDAVLDAFQQKHGKAPCRSWLASTSITGLRGNTVIIRCPSAFVCQWIPATLPA